MFGDTLQKFGPRFLCREFEYDGVGDKGVFTVDGEEDLAGTGDPGGVGDGVDKGAFFEAEIFGIVVNCKLNFDLLYTMYLGLNVITLQKPAEDSCEDFCRE